MQFVGFFFFLIYINLTLSIMKVITGSGINIVQYVTLLYLYSLAQTQTNVVIDFDIEPP